ncbi:hypothetical protein MMC17_006055 [Xylographa soralifera]|nr:hypothetical protein [Xylographa soralifera]
MPEITALRMFHLHDILEAIRMPRGITVGTCSLAVDIASATGDVAFASWFSLYTDMFVVLKSCVLDHDRGLGGSDSAGYGFVFTVVNPTTINVANTCMANQGPNRIDVVQCVHLLAASGIQGPNIPHPPANVATAGISAPNIPHPPPNMAAEGIPAPNLLQSLHNIPAVQPQLNLPGPSGAGLSPPQPPGDDMDPELLTFLLNLPKADSSGAGPSGASPLGASPDHPGAGVGKSGAGPSTSSAPPPWVGLGALGRTRNLPGAPSENTSKMQETYVGAKSAIVAGIWILGVHGWRDGSRKRQWKTIGQWFLVLGTGAPTTFPPGTVPPWTGDKVWTASTKPTATGREETPLSEAWIAEDGTWKPLAGMAPPQGAWVNNGGWVLLRGQNIA